MKGRILLLFFMNRSLMEAAIVSLLKITLEEPEVLEAKCDGCECPTRQGNRQNHLDL